MAAWRRHSADAGSSTSALTAMLTPVASGMLLSGQELGGGDESNDDDSLKNSTGERRLPPPQIVVCDHCAAGAPQSSTAWKIDIVRGEGGRRIASKRASSGAMLRWGASFGTPPSSLTFPEVEKIVEKQRWGRLPDIDRVRANPNIDHDKLWRPRCDIFQVDPDHLEVEIEVPSIPKEDISLTLKDNVLTIAALKPQTGREEHGIYYQRERNFGRFYRKITLPVPVEPKSAKTELDAGLLRLRLVIVKKVPVFYEELVRGS